MLTKEQILSKMRGFDCPKYLTESCWQPIYDQCVAAIALAAENERLKADMTALTDVTRVADNLIEMDRIRLQAENARLKAKLDDLRNLATEETYGTTNMSWPKAMQSVLAIINKDGE